MLTIGIQEQQLTIQPKTLDKLWGFKGDWTIPLAHVRGASADESIALENRGVRGPGLAVPGKYVGTFTKDGQKSYWNVSDTSRVLVITLVDEDFSQLVVTVENPVELEKEINRSIQK